LAVLAETATHTRDYGLRSYTLLGNQMGQHGTIEVEGNDVHLHLVDSHGAHDVTERHRDPVVVGPTLVGFVFQHLDALQAGEVLRVRLAVIDRLETVGFTLQRMPPQDGHTRIRMTPS